MREIDIQAVLSSCRSIGKIGSFSRVALLVGALLTTGGLSGCNNDGTNNVESQGISQPAEPVDGLSQTESDIKMQIANSLNIDVSDPSVSEIYYLLKGYNNNNDEQGNLLKTLQMFKNVLGEDFQANEYTSFLTTYNSYKGKLNKIMDLLLLITEDDLRIIVRNISQYEYLLLNPKYFSNNIYFRLIEKSFPLIAQYYAEFHRELDSEIYSGYDTEVLYLLLIKNEEFILGLVIPDGENPGEFIARRLNEKTKDLKPGTLDKNRTLGAEPDLGVIDGYLARSLVNYVQVKHLTKDLKPNTLDPEKDPLMLYNFYVKTFPDGSKHYYYLEDRIYGESNDRYLLLLEEGNKHRIKVSISGEMTLEELEIMIIGLLTSK